MDNAVALRLVDYIAAHELAPGAKLPSIRELASQLDCNQSQIRTGLITLSALGIIATHPRAGSFVKALAPGDLDSLFSLIFQLGMLGKDADPGNLYSVKTMLDKEIFINAIRYRTQEDLHALEDNLIRQSTCIDACDDFVLADEAFHLMLGRISRNPLVVFLLEAVQSMLRPYRHRNLTPDICRESYESHLRIYRAIKEKDEENAERIAVEHTLPRLKRLATIAAETLRV